MGWWVVNSDELEIRPYGPGYPELCIYRPRFPFVVDGVLYDLRGRERENRNNYTDNMPMIDFKCD